MKIADLHKLGQVLNDAFRCPVCGKSKLVKAIAHRGHGTGQRGASYYGPTAFEQVSAETHCMCPTTAPVPAAGEDL